MYTELEAVNHVLSQVGVAPVDDLSSTLPDIVTAQSRLREASLWLQKKGWWFNKLLGVEIEPSEVESEIILPEGTLKIIASYPQFVIERGGKAYDTTRQTYIFDQALTLDVVVFLEWTELPSSVQDCAVYRASYQHVIHELEDQNKAQVMAVDYEAAFIEMKKEDIEIKQRNAYSTPAIQRLIRRVRPYKRRSTTVDPRVPGGVA